MLPRNQGEERQVSRGTIWSVGGVAPAPQPVDDGHGRRLQSGTHAPVIDPPFCTAKPSSQEILENYNGRVATALDIDRVRRILDFDQRTTLPRYVSSKKTKTPHGSVRTIWNGSEWTNDKENNGEGCTQCYIDGLEADVVKNGKSRLQVEPFRLPLSSNGQDCDNLRSTC
jgi:hypothetical protein